jgi:hypothetical protein
MFDVGFGQMARLSSKSLFFSGLGTLGDLQLSTGGAEVLCAGLYHLISRQPTAVESGKSGVTESVQFQRADVPKVAI